MKSFQQWAEDIDPSAQGVNPTQQDQQQAISNSNLKYNLNKVTSNFSGAKETLAKGYPHLYRELGKLSTDARMDLYSVIQKMMGQTSSWGHTTSSKFRT